MKLQEIFNKAITHFAQMEKPSTSTPCGHDKWPDCAYRGYEGNKCIVGAFIDDEHYENSFEGKDIITYEPSYDKCIVQPVLNAVVKSMGVEALAFEEIDLLFKLQLIHDDSSNGFDIGKHNWYEVVKPYLIVLADNCGLEYNVG